MVTFSSSRVRFMSHNWSATKQRLHPQSVAEMSHHLVLSGDRIRQCETSSASRHNDTWLWLLWRTNIKSHGLSNRAIFNDLERPKMQISRLDHSLMLNISKVAKDTATVTMEGE